MTPKPARAFLVYSGPAGPLRQAIQRARRLQLMGEAGMQTWTWEGRSVRVNLARLMRCVMEEVEAKP